MTLPKNLIVRLLNENPNRINAAIRIIGENQTADELGSRHTKYENGIGFTASYGTIGTVLYQFVTGRDCRRSGHPRRWAPKSLIADGHVLERTRDMRRFKRNNPKYANTSPADIAKMIAILHWRQLGTLVLNLAEVSPEVVPQSQELNTVTIRFTRIVKETAKAILLEKVDAEGIAWERWIPKSMIITDGRLIQGQFTIKRPA